MSHDYKHRAPSRAAANKSSGWVWLMVGILAGAFLMGLIWLKLGTSETEKRWIGSTPDNPPYSNNAATRSITDNQSRSSAKPPLGQAGVAQEPKVENAVPQFEFFEKLPKQEVAITTTPLQLRETNKAKTDPNKIYYVQIASFNTRSDAERLRAELGFAGMETHINKAPLNGVLHYRVITGPFRKAQALQATRQQLEQLGHKKSLVITSTASAR